MNESDDEQSKREFYYHENNNKNNNIENDDYMSRYIYIYIYIYIYKVCCLKKPYNKPILLTSTAWSLREKIRPR